jgi:hypothetical protein
MESVYKSDNSTERVRRHRAKKNAELSAENDEEAPAKGNQETFRNVSETAVTPKTRPDQTKPENQDLKNQPTSPAAARGRGKAFNIEDHLTDEARVDLFTVAPGWDRQALFREYDRGIADGKRAPPSARTADGISRAFLGWVKGRTGGRPP